MSLKDHVELERLINIEIENGEALREDIKSALYDFDNLLEMYKKYRHSKVFNLVSFEAFCEEFAFSPETESASKPEENFNKVGISNSGEANNKMIVAPIYEGARIFSTDFEEDESYSRDEIVKSTASLSSISLMIESLKAFT